MHKQQIEFNNSSSFSLVVQTSGHFGKPHFESHWHAINFEMMKNSSELANNSYINWKLKMSIFFFFVTGNFWPANLRILISCKLKKMVDVTPSLLELYISPVAEMSNVLNRLGKVRTFVVVVCCKTPATDRWSESRLLTFFTLASF